MGLMICLPHESRPRIGCPGKSACKAPGDWLRHFLSDYLCAAPGAGAIPGSEQAGRRPGSARRRRAPLPRPQPRTAGLGAAPAARLPEQMCPSVPLVEASGCSKPEGGRVRPGRESCSFVCTESEIRPAGALLTEKARPQAESRTYRKCTCIGGTGINNSGFREGFPCSRI